MQSLDPVQIAARLHARGDIRVSLEPVPSVPAGEVLLRVTAVGLCGSDLHWFSDGAIGDARLAAAPDAALVLGHEVAAVIADGPLRGTRVALDPADPCGRCILCVAGHGELCSHMRFAGHGMNDGGLRRFMSWPERLLHPIPGSIDDAEASLLEPLGVAIHAIDLGKVTPRMRVAVVGCGPIGLLLILALRAAGIDDIVAGDLLPQRVAAAGVAGAQRTWLGPVPDGWQGRADVVFECAGDEAAVEAAIDLAGPAGRVVMVGIPGDDRTSFTASTARRKALTLVFCRRMTPADLDRAIELVSGGLALSWLISDRFALEDAPAAFAALAARRGLKVVIQPSP